MMVFQLKTAHIAAFIIVVALIVACCPSVSHAFQPLNINFNPHHHPTITAGAIQQTRQNYESPIRLSSDVEPDMAAYESNESNRGKDGKVSLRFFAETTFASNPAPYSSIPSPTNEPKKSLSEFFTLEDSAPILLRGANNNQVVEMKHVDENLIKLYEKQCQKVKAAIPTKNDRFFDVTTSGVQFPGLQVNSLAKIGMKLINNDNDGTFPSYEFVLIEDSTFATGSRFLVWLYDKMTGSTKGKKETSEQTTHSCNRIKVIPLENEEIAFECTANLGISISIPSFLLKMIPGGVQKTEESGSESLRKALTNDVPDALENFRRKYVEWIES